MDRKITPPEVNRRSLLQAMAASFALAAVGGRKAEADERALPYVNAPEFVTPGRPKWYATSVRLGGYLLPVLGKTEVGRPIKLEGNPDHPATEGATDAFMQAALLGLYDPGRSQSPLHLGQPATWNAFDADTARRAAFIDQQRGEGFRLLTGDVSSPTLLRQISDIKHRWPAARWHVSEPVNEDVRIEATRRVFGQPLEARADFAAAEIVVILDDDFLGPGPRQSSQARAWSKRRLAYQRGEGRAHLYVVEPTPSVTGTRADDRLIVSPLRIAALAAALAERLDVQGVIAGDLSEPEKQWVRMASDGLRSSTGRALFSISPRYGVELQVLSLLINERLGSFGKTLLFSEPVLASPPDGANSFQVLVDDMKAGRVTTLLALDCNPAFATPQALGFRPALEKVAFSIHAGVYADETAEQCHWHLPLQHELESWTDGRAVDGTAAIVQPLIRPFYAVRSPHVVLDRWLGGEGSDHDIVRASWKNGWEDALFRGFVADSAPARAEPQIVDRTVSIPVTSADNTLVADVRPDPTIWDGRFVDNAWLQETPKPLTKITWGNAILISPSLAKERGIKTGDELRLKVHERTLTGAAWIMPGQEARTLTIGLGYRQGVGSYDAFAFLDPTNPWHVTDVRLETTGRRVTIATTQQTQSMEDYDFVKTVASPQAAASLVRDQTSFYPERKWDSPSWGMSIDLDLCIGCNACLVACTAENNVPVVGRDLVIQGREMHWIRIDHYYEGDVAAPRSHFQPVPCMHCEQAPCEMGCPVNATVHSQDGLNLQVYNRCIGTRTCSAYCPYKVRRFNWFEFTGDDPVELKAMRNPDVTVRSRGVMEKCTYCIQRISAARIAAKIDDRSIADGDIVTACQQACPSQAIVFGDITDPKSAVSQRKASPRNYSLLEEANTRPRTTYLARIAKDNTP